MVRRKLATLATLLMFAVTTSGCANMTLGGTVVGSAAATDRLTTNARNADETIIDKAEQKIAALGAGNHIRVHSFNRRVLLTGEVKDDATKASAERAVNGIEGVQSIVNELEIAGPSNFGSRSNDAFLNAKVKTTLVSAKNVYANAIKVITERSVVYLMGRVSAREAQLASDITRSVDGVQKVVKVFEVISDEELKRLIAK